MSERARRERGGGNSSLGPCVALAESPLMLDFRLRSGSRFAVPYHGVLAMERHTIADTGGEALTVQLKGISVRVTGLRLQAVMRGIAERRVAWLGVLEPSIPSVSGAMPRIDAIAVAWSDKPVVH